MEKFKDENVEGITRREFLKKTAVVVAGVAVGSLCPALEKAAAFYGAGVERRFDYEKHGWAYNLEEMKNIYQKEYNGERLLRNVFKKRDGKIFGFFGGREFEVPQEFIDKTLVFFQQMIEQQSVRYLFRLDSFHGHFFVPMERFKSFYSSLDNLEQAKLLVKDNELGIIFHNTEHLKVDKNDKETLDIHSRRNVLAKYDGSNIKILPLPEGKRSAVGCIEGEERELSPYLRYAAHKDGEFALDVAGQKINLDISFDDNNYY